MLQEIDEYINQAKDRSYETMMRFGKRGLNIAATAAVTAATKVKPLCVRQSMYLWSRARLYFAKIIIINCKNSKIVKYYYLK